MQILQENRGGLPDMHRSNENRHAGLSIEAEAQEPQQSIFEVGVLEH